MASAKQPAKRLTAEPPSDLKPAQLELWTQLSEDHRGGFAAADLLVLRSVVDTAGRLDQVRAKLDADGLTVAGSMGQTRDHPLIAAETRLRDELGRRVQEWARICRASTW